MSLLQFEDDVNAINKASDLKWGFKSQITKFIKRFWKSPYRDEDTKWIQGLVEKYGIKVKSKLTTLSKLL